jgi:peptidoglycan-associated lipoprotein
LLILILAAASSCGSAPKAAAPAKPVRPATEKVDRTKTMDSDSDNALGLQTIRFPAVSLLIEGPEREKMVQNAAILKAHPRMLVEIEGHADGRGKMDQSFQLAEARAAIVKRVLIGLGIAATRMTTISYGKDKMLDKSGTEEGYARNRRVNFLILRY